MVRAFGIGTQLFSVLAILLMTMMSSHAAIDCGSVFPGPIQSFSSNGQLEMQNQSMVVNYDNLDVCFKKAKPNGVNNSSCGIGQCKVSGIPSLAKTIPDILDKTNSSINSNSTVASWTTPSVELGVTLGYGAKFDATRWDIGNVEVNGGSVTVSDAYDVYVFKSVTFYQNGTMTLRAGKTYIIDGDLNLSLGAINIIGTGNTQFYVRGTFTTSDTSVFNASSTTDIYVGRELELQTDSKVQGSFYVAGDATLFNRSTLTGRLSAQNVRMFSNSKVIYDTSPALECFTDDFSRTSLGNDWAIKVLGSSTPPSIVSNRLRITPASGNQATASTFQRLFPAENNLVTVEFDYYAWSPSSGTGGDGVAVILSDAAVTPQPGSFGGALGYAQRNDGTPGFAGGWLGVGLDEYGNFSDSNEGKVGRPATAPYFRPQSITLRGSAAANYKYLAGTAANLNPRVDVRSTSTAAPNHKYRIKVDSTIPSQAWVSVERDVRNGQGYQVLVPAFNARAISNQGAVPEDFYLSFTGSTGGANNNHEIDNFKVCALKSRPVGQQVHHFEFDYSSSPLTCKAETMAIRACANANCSQLFTDPVTAQLSLNPNANGAWYVGGVNTPSVNFVNGLATASLRYNVTTPPVTIGVSSSIPSTIAGSNTLCRKGTGPLNTASCTLSFAESGFIFDVPDKLANKPTSINISAVRKSNSSLECVPVFGNATKNVGFWSTYVSPSSIPSALQQAITIKGNSTGATTAIGKTQALRTQIPLRFTNGVASLEINYPDAGRVQLDARFDGTGEDTGLVMTGSDQFVSVPAGLCVKPVDASASCPSADMSCSAYRKAGQNFGMTLQAMAWEKDGDTDFCSGNLSTPNFSDQAMKLISKVVAPSIASGGHDGVLGVTSYSHTAQTNNLNTISNQSISEVGVFQITAQASPNYLGSASSLNIPIGYSANIGRFVPDSFLVGDVSVLPACGSFSYMDQPFPMSMSIKALNIGGAVTQNYFPPFSLATAKLVGENNNDGIDLQSRLSALPINAASWSQGVATVDATYRANFSRVTPNILSNLYQDGPFESLDIGVQALDNDPRPNGINSYVAAPDMDAASTGTCTNCNAKKISTQTLRHGRVIMDNTYGPETETLKMPIRAEYWNGTSWVLNTDDSCTTAVYGLGSQIDDTGLGYHFDPDLTTGQSINRSGAGSAFQMGQFDLLWRAVTTSGELYRGQVTAPLDVPAWLEWYWNWNGVTPTALSDPRASAYFGRYRGHDRIIYWREVN
ncbi:DUF6701 domain-containing protein [Shewanella xiamenensis]|uniref:DUF6701 domain-containing protein n=1 Tax=Shewanella xiamenensis TaxID=332186 RepID=UPI0024A79D76|nr:DUF6701 domain-containing protein [Shewanella xiamenensis]MDI5849396.1 MSHA biogenesis protein MshQ [Shewanella xiamenensis]